MNETPHLSPYDALFMDALRSAKDAAASDLHIEPTRTGLVIRMRVYGDMQPPWRTLEEGHRLPFIRTAKRLTGLEIGVSGRPQDGRLSLAALRIDVRVNLLPTLYGEKMVLRLLEQDRSFKMADLGLGADERAAVERALGYHDGVVLISGPTGSGKTTTLYTMLAALEPSTLNIVTLEDPVEYSLSGVNQVRITTKLTFAAALRAVLRQDPDVILLGEIRDRETAELAFQAASTGHLVLSTIHANGAAEVVTRLAGLGVEPYLLHSNLRFSGAQRLVKRLCASCVTDAGPEEGRRLPGTGNPRVQGPGCGNCTGGITGRTAVLEYMTGEEVKRGLASGTMKVEKTIAQRTLDLAHAGAIDIREVSLAPTHA